MFHHVCYCTSLQRMAKNYVDEFVNDDFGHRSIQVVHPSQALLSLATIQKGGRHINRLSNLAGCLYIAQTWAQHRMHSILLLITEMVFSGLLLKICLIEEHVDALQHYYGPSVKDILPMTCHSMHAFVSGPKHSIRLAMTIVFSYCSAPGSSSDLCLML